MTMLQQRSVLKNLEQTLGNRPSVAKHSSWERETSRGVQCEFGEYRLPITNTDGNEEVVVIHEDCSLISTRVWDNSALTSKWLEHLTTKNGGEPNLALALQLPIASTSLSKNRPLQVLELGAGTGLLSIFLAKMGAAVLSTEYGVSVKYLQKNCEKNAVLSSKTSKMTAGVVKCHELDWYKTTETLVSLFSAEDDEPIFDLIVVTDCSLTPKDSQGVIDMIHKYGTKGHTKVILGLCTEREGTPHCIDVVSREFQNVTRIQSSDFHPNYKSQRQIIYFLEV